MDVYTTEEQQVESIKKWWRENGKAVVIGAIIGIGGLYGWRYFEQEQLTLSEQASQAYVSVLDNIADSGVEAKQQVAQFVENNPGSYAALIELQLAKSFVDADDLNSAAQSLRNVQATTKGALNSLATLRLARIEAALGNDKLALSELDKISSKSWKAQVEELRGDIELNKGNNSAAHAAYAASLAAKPRPTVQMKLDNVSQ